MTEIRWRNEAIGIVKVNVFFVFKTVASVTDSVKIQVKQQKRKGLMSRVRPAEGSIQSH